MRMSVSISKKENQLTVMTKAEKKATLLLASLFSLRMLGLFMILPVLALYTHQYQGATQRSIGLALGCYGLTQAIFQIPLGWLSDKIGRKPVILMGLGLLALGSLVAAKASSIEGLILGRAIQGSGAIGATLLAFLADVTQAAVRARAMAIIGMTIGLSFGLAMIIGPLLETYFKLQGIFEFTFIFAVIGMSVLYFFSEKNHAAPFSPLYKSVPKQSLLKSFKAIFLNRDLQSLNISILSLHALFSTCFLFIPRLIHDYFPTLTHETWKIYAPVLLSAAVLMSPFIRQADKTQQVSSILIAAIMSFGLAIAGLLLIPSQVGLYAQLILFFAAFNILESLLPSLVSKVAPFEQRGIALGVYSTAQFLGIFLGGAIGGSVQYTFGWAGISLWCMMLVLVFIGAIRYVKRY